SAEDPVVISLSGTAVQLQIGNGAAQQITSNKVSVSGLSFTNHSNPGGRDSVSTSFTVAYNTGNPTQRFSQSLQTAVSRVYAATFDSNVLPGTSGSFSLGASPGDWKNINGTIFFSNYN